MPDRDIHSIRQCHARLRPYTTMSRQAAATNPSPGQGDLRTNRTMGSTRYTAACSMVSRPPSIPWNVAPPAQSTPRTTAACTARPQRRGRPLSSSAQRLRHARAACDPAIALYDDVAWLLEWLGQDILSVAGPAYAAAQSAVRLHDGRASGPGRLVPASAGTGSSDAQERTARVPG